MATYILALCSCFFTRRQWLQYTWPIVINKNANIKSSTINHIASSTTNVFYWIWLLLKRVPDENRQRYCYITSRKRSLTQDAQRSKRSAFSVWRFKKTCQDIRQNKPATIVALCSTVSGSPFVSSERIVLCVIIFHFNNSTTSGALAVDWLGNQKNLIVRSLSSSWSQ